MMNNQNSDDQHPYLKASLPNEPQAKKQSCGTMTVSFRNKLRKLGYASYRDYLASDHWKAMRASYRASGLPCQCLVCDDPRFQLHHRTYTRLGREQLGDVLPLCETCHRKVHEYERTHLTNIQGTHKILRKVFGWTRAETNLRFRPFSMPGTKGFSWVNRDLL